MVCRQRLCLAFWAFVGNPLLSSSQLLGLAAVCLHVLDAVGLHLLALAAIGQFLLQLVSSTLFLLQLAKFLLQLAPTIPPLPLCFFLHTVCHHCQRRQLVFVVCHLCLLLAALPPRTFSLGPPCALHNLLASAAIPSP